MSRKAGDIADTAGRKTRADHNVAALISVFPGSCANFVCEATGGYERANRRWPLQETAKPLATQAILSVANKQPDAKKFAAGFPEIFGNFR